MITFTIRGTVGEAESGIGLRGLFVKAYDEDLIFDDLLGSTHTEAGGHFEIVSAAEDFQEFFDAKPDIYIKVLTPDSKTELYSTEKAVRWYAGRLEEFEIDIPRDRLGNHAPERGIRLLDDSGQDRADFDVGESFRIVAEGVQPRTVHDVILSNEGGDELLTSRLLSNAEGIIGPTVIWPQFGLEDPSSH
jgi:hypothetical protein